MVLRFVERELTGWGRFPRSQSRAYRPEKLADISRILKTEPGACLARGMGRSYGDAALNRDGGVLLTERLNRFLEFDADTGKLTCEAGVRLDEVLEVCLPQGWFPPVTPGTKFVTLGGAVACDVHGKNHHHDGSLGRHLEWLELELADGTRIICSPGRESELFWATVGGLGLTGVILTLQLQLRKVDSAYLKVEWFRSRHLDETMGLMEQEDARFAHSVAWVDCMATGKNLGRSILIRGNHAGLDALPEKQRGAPLEVRNQQVAALPFEFPGFLLNPVTIRVLNGCYYRRFPSGRSRRVQHYDPFFYPLDTLGNWNLAYGKRGFVQYQCCFPSRTSAEAMRAILGRIAVAGLGSFLAVLKRFGSQEGTLSFPRPGYTLALDFPMKGRPVLNLLEELDDMVVRWGGRVYLAKDARLSRRQFERMYPDLSHWRKVRREADPQGRFVSDLARRLGLDASC